MPAVDKTTKVRALKVGNLKGCTALKNYLIANNLSIGLFSRNNGLDPSELHKLITGDRQRISVDVADKIERGTNGAVSWKLWVTKKT